MTDRSRRRNTTIEEYSRTINSEGISVRTRCYQVTTGERARYELLLDAAGQRAMVDIAATSPRGVTELVDVAARGFAASLAAQLGEGKRL